MSRILLESRIIKDLRETTKVPGATGILLSFRKDEEGTTSSTARNGFLKVTTVPIWSGQVMNFIRHDFDFNSTPTHYCEAYGRML
jgi:hypothetical protein